MDKLVSQLLHYISCNVRNSILKFFRCAYSLNSLGKGETKDFLCSKPITGRYVYITLMVSEILTLCEVEVYASGRFYIQMLLASNIIHIIMHSDFLNGESTYNIFAIEKRRGKCVAHKCPYNLASRIYKWSINKVL